MRRRRTKADPESSKFILPLALKRAGVLREIQEHQALRAFSLSCTTLVLRHVRPKHFSETTGVLHVQVESSAWAQELSYLKLQLLEDIRKIAGGEKINDLRFSIGPLEDLPKWSEDPKREAEKRKIVAYEDEVLRSLTEVSDREIRESLQRLYQAWGAHSN